MRPYARPCPEPRRRPAELNPGAAPRSAPLAWHYRKTMATIVAMKTLPLGDARDRFSALVASVEHTHDRVTVTRNGVPAAVLVSPADLEELEETISVLSSPALLRQLGESHTDLEHGDVVDAADDRDALLTAIRSRTSQ